MKKYIIISIFILILAFGGIMITMKKTKGGSGTGMFEKNSTSISLYYKDELVLTITGEQRKELVSLLQRIDMADYVKKAKDESYQYKLDCNNDWGIVYLSPDSETCYIGKDSGTRYTLPKETHTFIFDSLLTEK